MGIFKKWIAKIFSINQDDLPVNQQIIDKQIVSETEIDTIISQKVDEKINKVFQELKLAEKQVGQDDKTLGQSAVITSHDQIISAEDTKQVSKQITSDAIEKEVILPIIDEELENHVDVVIEEPCDFDAIPIAITVAEVVEPIDEIHANEGNVDTRTIDEPAIPTEADVSGILPIHLYTDDEEIHPLLIDSEEELEIKPAIEEAKGQSTIEPTLSFLESIEGKNLRLGIDFGTTTTAISLKIGEDLPEAIKIGRNGEKFIPSIVYVRPGSGNFEERVVIGEDAEAFYDQDHVIRSVKRCIGCAGGNCRGNNKGINKADGYPFPWCKGDGKLHVDDDEILPESIIYFIIKEAINRTIDRVRDEKHLDLNWENITTLPLLLGCGAVFNFEKREIIRKVAYDIGFTNVIVENVVEEPILAGFTFSRFMPHPEGRTLIFDFGGGTLDVAVMDVDRVENLLRVTVISTAGENWLGGDDIDALVYNHFINTIADQLNATSQELLESINTIDLLKIRNMSKKAKERLSSKELYSDVVFMESFGAVDIRISRKDFEEFLRESNIITSSFQAIKRACQIAYVFTNAEEGILVEYSKILKLETKELVKSIDRVLLVGGVTKIPFIRKWIESVFGANKIVEQDTIDPITAVAVGGSYPKEPQHYSIFTPPFELYIESVDNHGNRNDPIIVCSPYEYMDFHKYWYTNAIADFIISMTIDDMHKTPTLFARRVCELEGKKMASLVHTASDRYSFSFTLDGQIKYSHNNGTLSFLCDYPSIHPIQMVIRQSRKEHTERIIRERNNRPKPSVYDEN